MLKRKRGKAFFLPNLKIKKNRVGGMNKIPVGLVKLSTTKEKRSSEINEMFDLFAENKK
jgi:hypothetical protein